VDSQSDSPAVSPGLPDSLREAVAIEFRRALRAPYDVPLVILINGLLVLAFWFTPFKNQMFTLHGTLAFPIVLGSWMISDVPATNVLATDRHRVLDALDDEPALMRLLAAKVILLWVLVAPVCILVAVGIGIAEQRPISALWTIIGIGILPLGALAVSEWVGILWPYHPISLKLRWSDRRKVWTQIRWITLVCLPYLVVPLVLAITALPAALWWHHKTGGTVKPIPDSLFGQLVLLSAVTSVAVFFVARWVSRRLLRRRRDKLRVYLDEVPVAA
jgi:hypothetical protein